MEYSFYIQQYGTVVGPHTAFEVLQLGLPKDTLVSEQNVTKGEWVALGSIDMESLCSSEELAAISVHEGMTEGTHAATANEATTNPAVTKDDAVPNNLNQWNWGAFALPVIWGLFNGVYWTIGVALGLGVLSVILGGLFIVLHIDDEAIIFVVSLAISVGVRSLVARVANRSSWKKVCQERTAQDFEKSQKTWNIIGVILTVISIIGIFVQVSKF